MLLSDILPREIAQHFPGSFNADGDYIGLYSLDDGLASDMPEIVQKICLMDMLAETICMPSGNRAQPGVKHRPSGRMITFELEYQPKHIQIICTLLP